MALNQFITQREAEEGTAIMALPAARDFAAVEQCVGPLLREPAEPNGTLAACLKRPQDREFGGSFRTRQEVLAGSGWADVRECDPTGAQAELQPAPVPDRLRRAGHVIT
ncbi:MAG: hypothetical protein IV097_20775 [Burkholderiaceae bacterium]|nr:hypothetical protein [Burkholderiaceae bacterium]